MGKIEHFWNWARDANSGERVMYLDGIIASKTWFADEITPAVFRAELFSDSGDITIWVNSAGGDLVAASQIYTMLMDYKGNVTIKVDGLAASAASVICMAGTKVLLSPTATMMIHEPTTLAIGDSEEMLKASAMLDEFRESIINAYELRTNLSRTVLAQMMRDETWMNAHKAISLGFADGLITDEKYRSVDETPRAYSPRIVTNSLYDSIKRRLPCDGNHALSEPKEHEAPKQKQPEGIPYEALKERLILLSIK